MTKPLAKSNQTDLKEISYSQLSRLVFSELIEADGGNLLTDGEKGDVRRALGIGISSFSGDYADLTNKPAIPAVENIPTAQESGIYLLRIPAIGSASEGAEWVKTEEFANSDLRKLQGIQSGAKHNVNPDWAEKDPRQASFIRNKPADSELFSNIVRNWNETNQNSLAYVRNKPTDREIGEKVFNNIPNSFTSNEKTNIKQELDLTDTDIQRYGLLNIPATFTQTQRANFRNLMRVTTYEALIPSIEHSLSITHSIATPSQIQISPIFQIYRNILYLQDRSVSRLSAFVRIRGHSQFFKHRENSIASISGGGFNVLDSTVAWYLHNDKIYLMIPRESSSSGTHTEFRVYRAYFGIGTPSPLGRSTVINGRTQFQPFSEITSERFIHGDRFYDSFYIDGSDMIAWEYPRATDTDTSSARRERVFRFPLSRAPTNSDIIFDVVDTATSNSSEKDFALIGVRQLGPDLFVLLTDRFLKLRDSDGNQLMEPIDFSLSGSRAAGGIAIDPELKLIYIQVYARSDDNRSLTLFAYYYGNLLRSF